MPDAGSSKLLSVGRCALSPDFGGLPSPVASPCPSCFSQARVLTAPVSGEVGGKGRQQASRQCWILLLLFINEEGNGIESTL